MKQKIDYNVDWSKYFKVDIDSPSGLTRINDDAGKAIKPRHIGYQKFRKNGKSSTWRIYFQGRNHCVHRIIWVMIYGSIDPDLVIDHLDGNPFNNKIDNLALKTQTNNLRNQHLRSNNITGITGVSRLKMRNLFYYAAQWHEIDGCLKRKNFSISKLGEEIARDLAIACRQEQIFRLISEGADYTDRHGFSIRGEAQ